MRELKYAVPGKVANLRTFALDEPGQGGACHEYQIIGLFEGIGVSKTLGRITFQNGPINVDGNGINGVQNEDLLAIVIDRLEGFQSGKYACQENAIALSQCKAALETLQSRTKARAALGVEGTHVV